MLYICIVLKLSQKSFSSTQMSYHWLHARDRKRSQKGNKVIKKENLWSEIHWVVEGFTYLRLLRPTWLFLVILPWQHVTLYQWLTCTISHIISQRNILAIAGTPNKEKAVKIALLSHCCHWTDLFSICTCQRYIRNSCFIFTISAEQTMWISSQFTYLKRKEWNSK